MIVLWRLLEARYGHRLHIFVFHFVPAGTGAAGTRLAAKIQSIAMLKRIMAVRSF
jgi:hypothetical protein